MQKIKIDKPTNVIRDEKTLFKININNFIKIKKIGQIIYLAN